METPNQNGRSTEEQPSADATVAVATVVDDELTGGESDQPTAPPADEAPLSGLPREPRPAPASEGSTPAEPAARELPTIIARTDALEGTLHASSGVQVMGTFEGRLEVDGFVQIHPDAAVSADIFADDVIIGGDYSGTLTCRGYLDVQPSARVRGTIETPKMILRPGAMMDARVRTGPETATEVTPDESAREDGVGTAGGRGKRSS